MGRYWGDELDDFMKTEAKPVEGVAPQRPSINIEDRNFLKAFNLAFKKHKNKLDNEIESLGQLIASYIQQNLLADADLEIDSLIRRFEDSITEKLSSTMLQCQQAPLPQGTRFILPRFKSSVYVIEQQPGIRSIRYTPANSPGGKYAGDNAPDKFRTLSFPYVVFVIVTKNDQVMRPLYAAFAKKPLVSMSAPLYRFHMSNIYQGSFKMGVCDSIYGPCNEADNVTEKIENTIARFWQSGFNGLEWISRVKDERVRLLEKWEENSKDPMLGLKVDWHNPNVTLKKLIDTISTEGEQPLVEGFRPEGKKLVEQVIAALKQRLTNITIPEEEE
jgi:hypothetical protein